MSISSRQEHFSEVGKLAAMAFAGRGVIFFINLILARHLSVDQYENYVVAVAIFLLTLAITSQGLDKYALRMMPAKFALHCPGHAESFFLFSVYRLFIGAFVVAILALLFARELRDYSPGAMQAILISLFTLPFAALTYFLSAVISATGNCIRAVAVTYLIVPSLTLLFISLSLRSSVHATGAIGILCWLLSWGLGLALAAYWARKAWPAQSGTRAHKPVNISWQREARPFWFYHLSMGVIAQIAIILLDWLQPSATATGAYAAAMSMAALIAVLGAATNRVYAREMSIILEAGNHQALRQLHVQRLHWILPVVGIFLLVALTFTRPLLDLFHPGFAREGAAAFRILAVSTAATVTMGVAPIYLKHQKQSRIVFPTLASGALIQVILLSVLVPEFEATGAAIAYMISMIGVYGFFSLMSYRQIYAAKFAR